VQTFAGRTYFRRGTRWIDGALALDGADKEPDRTVFMGTPEYDALVGELREAGNAAQLAVEGDVLLRHKGENVLVVREGC
jgi:hypothetical protein